MANQLFPNAPINNPYAITQVGPDAIAQQYKMQQNQRIADMLMMQGQQQPQGQMVSGHYVAPSPLQYLSGLVSTGIASKINDDQPQQQSEYARLLGEQMNKDVAGLTGGAQMTNPQANAMQGGQGQMTSPQSGQAAPLAGMNPAVVANILKFGGPQQIGEFIRGVNMPTDLQKTDSYLGVSPEQSRTLELAKREAQGYIAPVKGGPGDILLNPRNPREQLVSIPKDGVQTNLGANGVATASPVKDYGDITAKIEGQTATAKAYGTGVGTGASTNDNGLYTAAQNAQKQVDSANRIINLLDQGAMTGTGAEVALQVAKALNVVGVDNKDTIKKTELLVSGLGQNVLDNVKASGLGAGNGFTDKDRQFLEKVVGGQITLDSSTLKELARLQKLTARQSVDMFNTRFEQMPESSRAAGWSKFEIKNPYTRSELLQELQRRKAKQGAQ